MIICFSCNASFIKYQTKADEYKCPTCGHKPQVINGFVAWAPELAEINDGFPVGGFKQLFDVEANSFWFRSRNDLILWALEKYSPKFSSLLEIGCGTGFVLKGIADKFPNAEMTGSEIYSSGLAYAARRLPNSTLVQLDARRLPYNAEFDAIAAFDVIEHISEDVEVLKKIHHSLKPDGLCLITVPQHQWLWSKVDVEACHRRRYSASDLHRKLTQTGFRTLKSTSFVTLLLPLLLLARLSSKWTKDSKVSVGLELNPLVDKLLAAIMFIERALIRLGVTFAVGGSRLVIARKIG